jgi:hypothetical protein
MFQPLKTFMPNVSKQGLITPVNPVMTHHNLVVIKGIKKVPSGIEESILTELVCRVKEFNPTELFLGYAIEPYGSWASGKPQYALVNKNGLNHSDMTFSIEESIKGKVLAYFSSKLGTAFEGGASTDPNEINEITIKQFVPVSVNNKPYMICSMKYKIIDAWVMGVSIPSFSTKGSGTFRFDVTINPYRVEVEDSYDDSLDLLKKSVKVVKEAEYKDIVRSGNLRYPNPRDSIDNEVR